MSQSQRPDLGMEQLAGSFSAEWLAAQRWFRQKSRGLARVELHDMARLDAGHARLLVLTAVDDAGTEDHYLVPAVADGGAMREPYDGEGVWQHLASLIAVGGELRAAHGTFVFHPVLESTGALPGGAASVTALAERRLTVEQSNTSVALGDRLMLKCYRLLEPGANPEVEINAFLTAARFGGAPGSAGSADYVPDTGQPCTVAMLQEFIASEGDAWNWVLARLGGGPQDKAAATAGIAQIGTLTKQLHTVLGSHPEVPGFPSRAATGQELATWQVRAEEQLDGALGVLVGDARARLLAIAPRIRERLAAIGLAGGTSVTRIHGDYHLGQVLRTARGFKVIDFEGEPARPLAERREAASPLRDLAGMLRSIDYAAQVSHQQGGLAEPEAWVSAVREAFLSSYGDVSATDVGLLGAFLIEKACYEIRYEADNRPDWIWVPLDAIERLVSQAR